MKSDLPTGEDVNTSSYRSAPEAEGYDEEIGSEYDGSPSDHFVKEATCATPNSSDDQNHDCHDDDVDEDEDDNAGSNQSREWRM